MSRPSVSVVMPFAGDADAAREAVGALLELATGPGDELILADNVGVAEPRAGVTILRAAGERSPAHARNVGAAHARGEWLLFLDADCRAPTDLLDRYFARPLAGDVGALAGEVGALAGEVGALAGEVGAAAEPATLAARYGAARGFLSAQSHLAHPYLPRAAAANLLVRRTSFGQLGGFYEGLRAAEDTDLCWRLQRAGWRLELRADARVTHRYRGTVGELRRQWRGYAAGRAWLARRYEGFTPEPAVWRGLKRLGRGQGPRPPASTIREEAPAGAMSTRDRLGFAALDLLLAVDELAGFTLSNRPVGAACPGPASVVLVADRYPERGDPAVPAGGRVEAEARPERFDLEAAGAPRVDYREDDGVVERGLALARLLGAHPLRCLGDRRRASPGAPPLAALAPAARRVGGDAPACVRALGGWAQDEIAARLAALSGAQLRRDDAER